MKAYLPSWTETALFVLALCMVMVAVEARAGEAAAGNCRAVPCGQISDSF